MTPRRILLVTLGGLGLALYLWPALVAPIVHWSDSDLDLDWARRGTGIWSPVVSPHHPPKPGYILFLRAALAAGPGEGGERRVVVIQSLLLWLSIAAAALRVRRNVGPGSAAALYVMLLLLLRLRDASSAVMSEAITAALLLPIAAVLLDPPARAWTAGLLGLATAGLFLVRPNAGVAALVLATASLVLAGRARRVAPLILGFLILWAPFWQTTAVPDDPFRGMAPAFITGSIDYGWAPEHQRSETEPPPFVQIRSALENWKATFGEERGDRGRQLVWRALHGVLGTDFYDARWSPLYNRATDLSRRITPLLTLASAAVLLAVPFRGRARIPKTLGLLLLAGLVAQSLILGALPRLALPFLAALVLYGIAALPGVGDARRRIAAAALLALLVAFVAWQRQVLDWEWGLVESPGVRIALTIPPGALPADAPATLHVRIAPLLLPTKAGLDVLGPRGEKLYESGSDIARERPFLTIPLPPALVEANRRRAVVLTLVSTGAYDEVHFLLFPIVPRPWATQSHREGTPLLSPKTGIASGGLDWWTHAGIR